MDKSQTQPTQDEGWVNMTEACPWDTTSRVITRRDRQREPEYTKTDTALKTLVRTAGGQIQTPELHEDPEAPSTRQSTSLWHADIKDKPGPRSIARIAHLANAKEAEKFMYKYRRNDRRPREKLVEKRTWVKLPETGKSGRKIQQDTPVDEGTARSAHPVQTVGYSVINEMPRPKMATGKWLRGQMLVVGWTV